MPALQEDIIELKRQLKKGSIRRAYRGLLMYMMDLRMLFRNKYESYEVSAIYQGYMDMTYFAIFPRSLKERDLKIAVVFNYEEFRFEAWLVGRNRKVQKQYWAVFRDSQCQGVRVVTPATGVDAIVECTLAEDFDFDDLDKLTSRIEDATIGFTNRIEEFLSEQQVCNDA